MIGFFASKSNNFYKIKIWSLILISLFGTISGIISLINQENDKAENYKKEVEKLNLVADRAEAASEDALYFFYEFITYCVKSDSVKKDSLIKIFHTSHTIEAGQDVPDPKVLDPIINLFMQNTMFAGSCVYTDEDKNIYIQYSKHKYGSDPLDDKLQQKNWLEFLLWSLSNARDSFDEFLIYYGGTQHEIIRIAEELRLRSKNLIFLFQTNIQHEHLLSMWKNGIPLENHLEGIRYYLLWHLKLKQSIWKIRAMKREIEE